MSQKFNLDMLLKTHTNQKSALLVIYKQCKETIRLIEPLLENSDIRFL